MANKRPRDVPEKVEENLCRVLQRLKTDHAPEVENHCSNHPPEGSAGATAARADISQQDHLCAAQQLYAHHRYSSWKSYEEASIVLRQLHYERQQRHQQHSNRHFKHQQGSV